MAGFHTEVDTPDLFRACVERFILLYSIRRAPEALGFELFRVLSQHFAGFCQALAEHQRSEFVHFVKAARFIPPAALQRPYSLGAFPSPDLVSLAESEDEEHRDRVFSAAPVTRGTAELRARLGLPGTNQIHVLRHLHNLTKLGGVGQSWREHQEGERILQDVVEATVDAVRGF